MNLFILIMTFKAPFLEAPGDVDHHTADPVGVDRCLCTNLIGVGDAVNVVAEGLGP